MTKAGQPWQPWHVPVRLEDVPETGLHIDLVADDAVRADVGAFAGLRDLSRLEAAIDLVRHGNGLRATGQVSATVGQTCVITLDPMESSVEEAFDVTFAPPASADTAGETAEPPEALVDGVADIGAVATEFLLLGIDRYPKKSGALFTPPAAESAGAGPFMVLARLKNPDGGKR